MLLSGHIRLRELIMRKSQNDQRLRQLNIELEDLKRYAEHIADGNISLWEMMKTPTSMFNRQMLFLNTSSVFCDISANNQMYAMMANPNYQRYMMNQMQNNPDPMFQDTYNGMMYNNFYQEAQKEFARYETELLHEKEGAIRAEKDSLIVDNEAIAVEAKELKEKRKEEIQQTFSSQA